MIQPMSTKVMPSKMKGKRRPVRPEMKAPAIWQTIPISQMGIDMAWARAAFHPSSVRMVGMNADIEAAVMSQQKNINVLLHVSKRTVRSG